MLSGAEERAGQNQVLQITSISICFIFIHVSPQQLFRDKTKKLQ